MKKLMLIICLLLLCSPAYAISDTCLWVWTADIEASTGDAPDEVHCKLQDASSYSSVGATYIQQAAGAKTITITFDHVDADGSTTIASLVSSGDTTTIPDNANVNDLHIVGSANRVNFDAGGPYYYTYDALAVDDTDTFALTPIAYFKLLLGTDTDNGVGAAAVWTTVTW